LGDPGENGAQGKLNRRGTTGKEKNQIVLAPWPQTATGPSLGETKRKKSRGAFGGSQRRPGGDFIQSGGIIQNQNQVGICQRGEVPQGKRLKRWEVAEAQHHKGAHGNGRPGLCDNGLKIPGA